MLACVAAVTLAVAVMPASQAGSAVTLNQPRVKGDDVVLTGHAAPRAKVTLTRRTASGWKRVTTTRATRTGWYRTKVGQPKKDWQMSAVAGGNRSEVQTVPADTPTPTPTPTDPTPTPTPTDPTPTDPTTTPTTPPVQTDACGARPVKDDGSLWSCTFHDDFDGTTLDTNTWLVQETAYSGMTTGAHACYLNQPDTIAVADGALQLSAHRNLAPFTCKSPYGDFTTTETAATVATRNSFTQTYGRFEFRAKFPDIAGTPGAHSALWMYPRRMTYGAWPASGEIDVAEWFSALPDNAYPSVHYQGEQPPQSTGLECAVADAGTRFHTYGVEWTPTVMKFFYDGTLCWEHAWTASGMTGSQPFDQPFYLVLTQAFGALWNAPTAQTPNDITMDVDWARAWN